VKSIDEAHTGYVSSVSYSPNGRILVSAGGDKTMKIWDAETFELKHTFEQEFYTLKLTITADSNYIVSANWDKVRITPCREYHLTGLTPILNLILHIVYKWEFVSFLEPNENTSPLEKVMRLLGECVHDGGYNVTSEILSFLSPVHLPIQITPTRWKSTRIFVMLDEENEIEAFNHDDDDYGVNYAENESEEEEEGDYSCTI